MTEQLRARLERKAVADIGSGEISGFAAVYGNVDLQDDQLEPGALTKTVSDWSRSKSKVPLLDWHGDSLSRLIGSVVELKSAAEGLWFRAGFSASEAAQQARQLAREGHLSGVSIGYLPIRATPRWIGEKMVRVLHEVRLLEISLTPVPANPLAQLASVKALDVDGGWDAGTAELEELEAWARQAAGERARDELGALAAAPASTWQTIANMKADQEAERMERDLMAWARSPEVAAAVRRDPAREQAVRDQARRDRVNERSYAIVASMARLATDGCGCCWSCRVGGRCIHA